MSNDNDIRHERHRGSKKQVPRSSKDRRRDDGDAYGGFGPSSGWCSLVAILCCLKLWRRTYQHPAPLPRAAANSTPNTQDGYAVRAMLSPP